MTYEELREKVTYHFTADDLLDELESYLGSWKMEEIFRDICNTWSIPLDEDEDEDED